MSRRLLSTLFLLAVAACGGTADESDHVDESELGRRRPEPTEKQKTQAESFARFIDDLSLVSAWDRPVDLTGVKERERRAIYGGNGSDAVFYGALWRGLAAVPQGHQAIHAMSCGSEELPIQYTSRFGVCGRASGGEIVVTVAEADNPLGLALGDRIVATGGDRGVAMLDAAAARPVCGVYVPAETARRSSAAASFFGTVPRGTTLVVKSARGGAERRIVVPAVTSPRELSCADPFGRDVAFNAKATKRPDGTAIIRLPRLTPIHDTENPQTEAEIEAWIARFRETILREFEQVKDAPRLVWDIRGNAGGVSPIALAIVGGMPSARPTKVSYCTRRIEGTSPPQFDPTRYAEYYVTPGGPFAYSGKVAVVIDGLDYSAADYFALAVARATDVPLVGEQTAGAYGGSGARFTVNGPPEATVFYDPNRCVDAQDDSSLEGRGTKPTHPVTYKPTDAARGVDTLLEAAIALTKRR